MRLLRNLSSSVWMLSVYFGLGWAAVAVASDNRQSLDQAIRLFDQGKYVESQALLLAIDEGGLDQPSKGLRDQYLQRTRVASNMQDKARLDLEEAQQAVKDDDYRLARDRAEKILTNEYAARDVRSAAQDLIHEMDGDVPARSESTRMVESGTLTAQDAPTGQPVRATTAQQSAAMQSTSSPPSPSRSSSGVSTPANTDSDRARTLTEEGFDALGAGRTSEAVRLFEAALAIVPGHPQATVGLREARRFSQVEVGSGSMIERIQQKQSILWGRTQEEYHNLEAEIRDAVLARRFDLAEQLLLRARQVLESGRQYADPVTKYENLVHSTEALESYIADERRRFDEQQVREQREAIRHSERERQQQVSETRQRQVDALMEQAMQLRKDREFDASVRVLEQVMVLDPLNDQARWLRDDIEDLHNLTRQADLRHEMLRQQQKVLTDTDESKIPWHDDIKYPSNWLEIISSPERVASGQDRRTPADQELYAKLDNAIPVDFADLPLEEVIDDLAESQAINITVVWNDLESVGIDRSEPVTLRFPSEVRLGRVLEETLDLVGGSEVELGYVINDGVIKVATRQLLDRQTYVNVYPIDDLLLTVPEFTGPRIELTGGGGQGGGGAGGFGGGMGGGMGGMGGGMMGGMGGGMMGGMGGMMGGMGGMGGGNPFSDGGDEQDDDDGASREERVEELLELIRNTIAPDSWRENGGTVASIAELNGQLVVTQTSSAHSEIHDLLSKLREQRAIQIAIEARFITITSNYLEELGIDLDVVLNQGNAGFDRTGRTFNGAQVLLPRSFSRLGFIPGVPGVGTQLQQGGAGAGGLGGGLGGGFGGGLGGGLGGVGGGAGGLGQPYGNAALVPAAGGGLVSASNMTPIPIISNILDLVQPTSTVVPGSFGGTTTPAMQVFGSFLDGIQVDFLLQATQADRRSSIMNAPRLVLFNGQRAWVGVLNSTSFVSAVFPVVDEGAVAQAPITQQLQTGTVLDVQAVVSADKRYVTMNLRPGVSQPAGIQTFAFSGGAAGAATASDAFIQLPNTLIQVIRTTVSVPDGGTLLIGGLKTTQEIEAEAGVPVLSKIPVLKRLYSARNVLKDEQVLLILIKPKIMIQREQELEAFPTFGQAF